MKKNENGKIPRYSPFFSENDRKTIKNDRKNGSFGCAAKNEFFDFSTKFHSNSSIFRENSLIFH